MSSTTIPPEALGATNVPPIPPATGAPPAGGLYGDGAPIKFDPMVQLGRSGLKQYGGFVLDEKLQNLRNPQGARAFREIVDNSALVGGIVRLIQLTMRQISKYTEPYTDEDGNSTPEDEQRATRLDQAMDDMSHSWADTISEIVTMIVYGFAPMELIWKRCGGWSDTPGTRSKYDDGVIAPRKIALRAQDTLFRWEFDQDGGVRAMLQLSPPDYILRTIPIEKLLLFRPEVEKDNPEGRSVLRSGYYSWIMIKRYLEFEAIKAERDAAGLPYAKIPGRQMTAGADQSVYNKFKTLVTNIRVDDQAGIVIPSDMWPDSKTPMFEVGLLSSGGKDSHFDFDKPITRHEVRLAMSMLSDVMMLGHDKVGSFALSGDKRSMMADGIGAWLDSIYGVINRHFIPRMWALNGWPLDRMARMDHGEVQERDVAALADIVQKLSASGMPLFPDDNLESHFREELGWPEKSAEAIELQATQQEHEQALQEASLMGIQAAAEAPAGDPKGRPGKPAPFGKRAAVRKARHQPRSMRGKYQHIAGPHITNALRDLRDRKTVGANDSVAHGFKTADPPPFDPKAMAHILDLDKAPVQRVALRDLTATQPSVRRETVRAFIERPDSIVPGQRNLQGQILDRPVAVRHENKLYIADGHHRLAAKMLLGYPEAMVRVVEPEGLPADQGQPVQ